MNQEKSTSTRNDKHNFSMFDMIKAVWGKEAFLLYLNITAFICRQTLFVKKPSDELMHEIEKVNQFKQEVSNTEEKGGFNFFDKVLGLVRLSEQEMQSICPTSLNTFSSLSECLGALEGVLIELNEELLKERQQVKTTQKAEQNGMSERKNGRRTEGEHLTEERRKEEERIAVNNIAAHKQTIKNDLDFFLRRLDLHGKAIEEEQKKLHGTSTKTDDDPFLNELLDMFDAVLHTKNTTTAVGV